jgi:hypothetical protein
MTFLGNIFLHSILKLGPWQFHYGEARKSRIISSVDGKGGK